MRKFGNNARMKSKVTLVARVILGLIYFVFGLNHFVGFMPMTPPPMPEAATEYMKGMMAAGYFMPLLKGTETIGGFLLLIGYAAPLALVVLAPITLHIVLFHGCLTPGVQNIVMPIIMAVAHIVAAVRYWPTYRQLFKKG